MDSLMSKSTSGPCSVVAPSMAEQPGPPLLHLPNAQHSASRQDQLSWSRAAELALEEDRRHTE